MGEFLNISCPVCHRVYPVSTWAKIAVSEAAHLGVIQRSEGRGAIFEVGKVFDPEGLDWIKLDGFRVSIRREPSPFELVKGSFLRALSRWISRGWLTDADLITLGLAKLTWDSLAIRRSVSSIREERVVVTKRRAFEL